MAGQAPRWQYPAMGKSKEVEAWLARYQNPMKEVVLRIREIILEADQRIDECIKWQAPTFAFQGNLASFFPKSKQHASLMFHLGARIPGDHPRLEGSGDTSRVMKIGSVAEANAARPDLERIVRAWCEWRASGTKKGPPTPPRVRANTRRGPSSSRRPPSTSKAKTKSRPARGQTRR
jgi:uncharacterized protein YdhG (YjbR/CyaY superfamily)